MKILIRLGFVLTLGLSCATIVRAKEWRGIVPLRSTKSDVVRLLNRCSDSNDTCMFTTESEDVYIVFSGAVKDDINCGNTELADTVIFVEVRPRAPLKLDSLRLDKRHLVESFYVPSPYEHRLKAYRTKDGLVVSSLGDRVLQLDYIGDSNSYGCREYYEDVQAFVQTLLEHPPPMITIVCDQRELVPGERFSIGAAFIPTKRGFTWRVDGGKIISGQGTHGVSLETTGRPGYKLTVTAEFEDAFRKITSTTCAIPIVAAH